MNNNVNSAAEKCPTCDSESKKARRILDWSGGRSSCTDPWHNAPLAAPQIEEEEICSGCSNGVSHCDCRRDKICGFCGQVELAGICCEKSGQVSCRTRTGWGQ